MQEIITELLWRNPEIDEAASRLQTALPGFSEVQHSYEALAQQVRAAAGNDLYDRYYAQLMRYSGYEVRAYYSLGLGLRTELARGLVMNG